MGQSYSHGHGYCPCTNGQMEDFYADYADPYMDDFEWGGDELGEEGKGSEEEGAGIDHDKEDELGPLEAAGGTAGGSGEGSHDESDVSGGQQHHGDRDELDDADESQPPRGSKGPEVEGSTVEGMLTRQEPEPFKVSARYV